MNQHNAQRGWLQFAASNNIDIVALTDVVDMYWDTSISTNTVLLHEGDELTLSEVVRRASLFLCKLHLRRQIGRIGFRNFEKVKRNNVPDSYILFSLVQERIL